MVALLCGGQITSICIDPNTGGATCVDGLMRRTPRIPRDPYVIQTWPQAHWSVKAILTLSAGYVGSSVFGFLFVVSESVGCANGSLLLVRSTLGPANSSPHRRFKDRIFRHCARATRTCLAGRPLGVGSKSQVATAASCQLTSRRAYLSILGSEAILIGLWFGDHGNALRFYGRYYYIASD
jgi:hypothetical protein